MAGAVLYALGGGSGHLARATVYATRCFDAEAPLTIVHSAGAPIVTPPPRRATLLPIAPHAAPAEVRARVALALGPGRRRELVVDAFPGGLGWEIDDGLLALASRTTLLARYVKPLSYDGYDALAARYDRTVLPYAAGRCEWGEDGPVSQSGAVFSGPLVRVLGIAKGRAAPLAIVGRSDRLPIGLRRMVPAGTVQVDGILQALPPARAYLAASAGYNLAYELDRLGVPFGLLPEDKRYDDQFRRADLLGRTIASPLDLEKLLAEAA